MNNRFHKSKQHRQKGFDLKAHNEREHFKNRLMERYGMSISKHEYSMTVRRILQRNARLLCEISQKLSVWEVEIKGGRVYVLFDSKREELVTAFTEDMNVGDYVRMSDLLAADRPMTRHEYQTLSFPHRFAPQPVAA